MTPYFFRGSVLISDNIISYTEFMSMTVSDFEKIEKFIMFKHDYRKNRDKQSKASKTKAELSGLKTIDVKELGFSDEQMKGLYN